MIRLRNIIATGFVSKWGFSKVLRFILIVLKKTIAMSGYPGTLPGPPPHFGDKQPRLPQVGTLSAMDSSPMLMEKSIAMIFMTGTSSLFLIINGKRIETWTPEMSDIHFKHVLGNERHGETAPKRVMFVKSKPFSMMPAEKRLRVAYGVTMTWWCNWYRLIHDYMYPNKLASVHSNYVQGSHFGAVHHLVAPHLTWGSVHAHAPVLVGFLRQTPRASIFGYLPADDVFKNQKSPSWVNRGLVCWLIIFGRILDSWWYILVLLLNISFFAGYLRSYSKCCPSSG